VSRERVPLRVHGPFRHRNRWRLDVFENGKRTKQTYASYGEALLAAHRILTGAETFPADAVSVR
jgi:hypothetical protein